MADNVSIFALEVVPQGWFSRDAQRDGWFDRDLLDTASVVGSATGTISGSISVTADIQAQHGVAGQIAGSIGVTGDASAGHGVAGQSAGVVAITGSISAFHGASGIISGVIPIVAEFFGIASSPAVIGTINGSIIVTGLIAANHNSATGGGAIMRPSITRVYRERDLETDLGAVLASLKRPATRSKRKRAISGAEGSMRVLMASVKAASSSLRVPLSVMDLQRSLDTIQLVETGSLSPAEWRALAIAAANQAMAEMVARRLMIEEEESVMMLLMAA